MISQNNNKETPEKCIKCAKKVPIVCFFSNLTLAMFKMAVGALTGSKGLFADGIHSLSDVVATSGVIVSLKISEKGEDENYPYGRGKAEFISCIFVYAILFLVSILILSGAIKQIIENNLKMPHLISLFAAVVSVIANLLLSRMGFCAGKAINSPAIIANANENKADMLSSVAVIFGIIGCHLGFRYADALAAIFVGLIILITAVTLGWKSIEHLIDTSLPGEKIKQINNIILKIDSVQKVNYIKTRRLGQYYRIDAELVLSPELTVQEGDAIAQQVKSQVLSISDKVKDVLVIISCGEPEVEKDNGFLDRFKSKFAFSE